MAAGPLPIEIGIEKAKKDILRAINQIGNSYDLPSSIVLMIVEQIAHDTRLNTYETIITTCDISIPEKLANSQPIKQQVTAKPLTNDDVEMVDDSVKDKS